MKRKILFLVAFCNLALLGFSQKDSSYTIKGRIVDENNEPLAGTSVKQAGSSQATLSDSSGAFKLKVSALPVIIEISFAEYETEKITVSSEETVSIIMQRADRNLDPVVISADRVEGKLTRSAVSIERSGKEEFINSANDPYGHILGKKSLDVTVSSLTYKTYSTRGFNGSGSSRVNQLMDGMDNQAPGLNFYVGNFSGVTDLDIESIEILPGASSALYGPGGVNGTILINSKNPFKTNGFSLQVKNGITDIGKKQRNKPGAFYDYSFRWAKNLNDRLSFKISGQYLKANDWLANDSSNYLRSGAGGKVIAGNRQTDPNYDGVNVYGDETSFNVHAMPGPGGQPVDLWNLVGQGIKNAYPQLGPGIDAVLRLTASPLPISRTGYQEIDVVDPVTKNIRLNGALHYQFKNGVEAILAGHWGTGNTVYTGNNRYALKVIKIGQYKLELRHKNWFLRGFTTQEDAGEAYSATVTTQYFNEAWKPSGTWYQQYAQNYLVPAATLWLTTYGQTGSVASADAAIVAANMNFHNMGRAAADQGRPSAGSSQFQHIFDSVRRVPIPNGGLFLEKSQLWMSEGQYNFSDKLKFAELIVGGNLKKYILNSQGTLFIDTANAIKINEWGMYAQATKKLFDGRLVVAVSGRYDKNENFKGKLTPRVTALVNIAEGHHLRFSYQTAYKFPTTQQQWIRLDVGNVMLLGGLPWVSAFMNTKSNPTFVYNPPAAPVPFVYKELKPESMRSFEAGYKALINKKLLIDMYAYFGKYTDFLGRIVLVQPTTTNKPYSVVTNSKTSVNTWGAGIGFDYKMRGNYFSFFNAYTDNLTNVPTGFMAGFNTPKYRLNAGFGNSGLGKSKRIGFSLNLRWQDAFWWEGSGLADGTVKAYTTLDAQVNYKLPKIKSVIKIGGTNITNKFYQTGFGNPSIGGLYYASFIYNL